MKACFLEVLPASASCFCILFPMYINICFIKLFVVKWYYEGITHVSNVQQCVADPPCAGRGTSLWHLVHSPRAPRDARVSLERERETQRKQRVGSNVLLIKCPVSPSFSNIILQADLFFMIEKCEHTYFTKTQSTTRHLIEGQELYVLLTNSCHTKLELLQK